MAEEKKPLDLSLTKRIIHFNLSPINYIHASWIKDVDHAQLVAFLRKKEDSHVWLSKYLLNFFELSSHFDYEFISPEKRIALASTDELLKLILYIGIVINEQVIRSVIVRSQRAKLEQCLGTEAYYFAVKKAQFLSSNNYQQIPLVAINWDDINRFKSLLMANGLKILSIVYSDMPSAFKKRLSLKLPKSWCTHLEQPADNLSNKSSVRNLLIKSYKEVNREWQHLLY